MENSANIIPFPVDRDLYFIRETARQLVRRNGEMATKFFRTECNRLSARMQHQGFDRETIAHEVRRFSSAVQVELQRSYLALAGGAA